MTADQCYVPMTTVNMENWCLTVYAERFELPSPQTTFGLPTPLIYGKYLGMDVQNIKNTDKGRPRSQNG